MTTPTHTIGEQLDIFTAVRLAGEHANRQWHDIAMTKVREICERQEYLTTDDLWAAMESTLSKTHDNRAAGHVMTEAKNNGWCAPTDRMQRSARKECHHRRLMVWQSLLHPLCRS